MGLFSDTASSAISDVMMMCKNAKRKSSWKVEIPSNLLIIKYLDLDSTHSNKWAQCTTYCYVFMRDEKK
jgi:hypothetical protein